MKLPQNPPVLKEYIPYSDEVESTSIIYPDDNDPVDDNGTALFEQPITDRLIHTELRLPQEEELRAAKVIRRNRDSDGNFTGTYDDNPMLNTMIYDVDFNDGEVREYSANIIAVNMYSQVDANGNLHNLLDSIIDYERDSTALHQDDMFIFTNSGK